MNPILERIARRLERDGKRLEAQALRAVSAAYSNLSLADLVALVDAASQAPDAARRVAQVDQLMGAFRQAAQATGQAPDILTQQLRTAVTNGVSAGAEMLAAQVEVPGLIDAFRVRPDAEIDFTQHAAQRLTRYWGTEQDRLRNEVQSALLEGLERGQSSQQIAARLRERVDVSRTRASLIVRNELSNAAANAQRESQKEAGVTHYVWWTAQDKRVRGDPEGKYPKASPSHYARHGKKFSWDDPPSDGHPGEPICCRCVALAVIPEEFK